MHAVYLLDNHLINFHQGVFANVLLKGKLDHHNGRVLSVKERIAITLWRLGTNVHYTTIGLLFGVGLSTVSLTNCQVRVSKLMSVYIKVPRGDALQTIRGRFLEK